MARLLQPGVTADTPFPALRPSDRIVRAKNAPRFVFNNVKQISATYVRGIASVTVAGATLSILLILFATIAAAVWAAVLATAAVGLMTAFVASQSIPWLAVEKPPALRILPTEKRGWPSVRWRL